MNRGFDYIDPPYMAGLQYKHQFHWEDHKRLKFKLSTLNTSWILSYDDHEDVRRLYPHTLYNRQENVVKRGRGGKDRRFHEILIQRRQGNP